MVRSSCSKAMLTRPRGKSSLAAMLTISGSTRRPDASSSATAREDWQWSILRPAATSRMCRLRHTRKVSRSIRTRVESLSTCLTLTRSRWWTENPESRSRTGRWTRAAILRWLSIAIEASFSWRSAARPSWLVFSMTDGKSISKAETCGDVDDLFVDAKRERVYVSCGAGFIDVFETIGTTYRHMARIPTLAGARTSLFVPEMDRLLVAVRAGPAGPAAIWMFKPMP